MKGKWLCNAAYIAWFLFVALLWLVKTSYIEAIFITAGREQAALCKGKHGFPVRAIS